MGVKLSKKKFCPRPSSADEEFPIHGHLGLNETEKIRIKSSWDRIGDSEHLRAFIGAFLFSVMTKNHTLKAYFRLKNVDDENLHNDDLFQTHIGNFNGIFRVVLNGLVKKTGAVQRKARSLGFAHRRFDEVKFEKANWLFMIECFVDTLHVYVKDLTVDEKYLWKRFLKWFFSQMHRAHELGENYESD